MNKYIFNDHQQLNRTGASMVQSLLLNKQEAIIGLATGGTPVGIYKEIVHLFSQGAVSFNKATTFNLDEYVGIPAGHSQSYITYMKENLFDFIDLPPEHANIPNGNARDLLLECERYNRLLDKAKQIDMQILGLGHNGHIGFNEPDHSLISGTHLVKLRDETRIANARFFRSLDEVPSHAITMGIGTILKAKSILLVVCGAEKAEIAFKALCGPITTECPASLLQTHPNLTVLLDSEAGRLFHES